MVPRTNGFDDEAKLVLLVAEDDVAQRYALSTILRDTGWEVYEASNAEDALRLWRSPLTFDVLITDVEMPGAMDGLELVKTIRSEDAHILLVVVSGLDLERQMTRQSQVFFRKPIQIDRLLEFLRNHLARRRSHGR